MQIDRTTSLVFHLDESEEVTLRPPLWNGDLTVDTITLADSTVRDTVAVSGHGQHTARATAPYVPLADFPALAAIVGTARP